MTPCNGFSQIQLFDRFYFQKINERKVWFYEKSYAINSEINVKLANSFISCLLSNF